MIKITSTVELEACPPPLGIDPPPGCNKTFVEDVNGTIPCKDDLDWPENRELFREHKYMMSEDFRGFDTIYHINHTTIIF